MANLKPDPTQRREFILSLFLGEILTRRGEAGPLVRLWKAAVRDRKSGDRVAAGRRVPRRGV